MKLYTGNCAVDDAQVGIRRCKAGTPGCIAKHVRRPNSVVLAEERAAALDAILAELSRGTASERNVADDIRTALDKVTIPVDFRRPRR